MPIPSVLLSLVVLLGVAATCHGSSLRCLCAVNQDEYVYAAPSFLSEIQHTLTQELCAVYKEVGSWYQISLGDLVGYVPKVASVTQAACPDNVSAARFVRAHGHSDHCTICQDCQCHLAHPNSHTHCTDHCLHECKLDYFQHCPAITTPQPIIRTTTMATSVTTKAPTVVTNPGITSNTDAPTTTITMPPITTTVPITTTTVQITITPVPKTTAPTNAPEPTTIPVPITTTTAPTTTMVKTDVPTTTATTGPAVVDGGWGTWGEWSSCTVTCGSGITFRFRTCTNPVQSGGGAKCDGTSFDGVACLQGSCDVKVDGDWTDWSTWGDCSVSCGDGFRTRTQTCTNPAPSNGGADCVGTGISADVCSYGECSATIVGRDLHRRGGHVPHICSSCMDCTCHSDDHHHAVEHCQTECSKNCDMPDYPNRCIYATTTASMDHHQPLTNPSALEPLFLPFLASMINTKRAHGHHSCPSCLDCTCHHGHNLNDHHCVKTCADHCGIPDYQTQCSPFTTAAPPPITTPMTTPSTTTAPSTTTTPMTTATTTLFTTTVATTPPVTANTDTTAPTHEPLRCFACSGTPDVCAVAYHEQDCPASSPFCINDLHNYANGTFDVVRRCGTENECFNEWYQTYSDDDRCTLFDNSFSIFIAFHCKFCCTKSLCNLDIRPPTDTLYVSQ